ncbi:MAG TPA: aminotransferase class III-fold pyridoxal phosphate-dependent enzyme [Planctomycetota bacterium]|nr:aminotransferase class III-fold pyridoxal phosphate-dependent enzyme [Planctomycetota bacterium]
MTTAAFLSENGRALAAMLASEFGLAGSFVPLYGEVDLNLRLEHGDRRHLVKVAAPERDPRSIDLQVALLEHVAARAPALPVQRVVRDRHGNRVVALPTAAGPRLVWVTTWLEGTLFAHLPPAAAALRADVGRCLAELDRALLDFEHAHAARDLKWDLRHAGWIGEHLDAIEPPDLREIVAAAHRRFAADLAPRLASVRQAVIHGDANDHNLLAHGPAAGTARVLGVLDFGDACRSALVGEVAIAAAYLAMAADDPLQAIDDVVRGYDEVLPLDDDEVALVVPLVATRLAVSITNAAVQQRLRPGDPYVLVSQAGARRLLPRLQQRDVQVAELRLRLLLGRDLPRAQRAVHTFLREHGPRAAPVLGADLSQATVLDWSFESLLAGDDALRFDAEQAGRRTGEALRAAGATFGLGRYLEPRPIYTGAAFGGAEPNAARRTVHLGIDVFAPAGTAVHAPWPATVHSAAHCPGELDYGGLVVLRHTLPDGGSFGTLYGHLDPRGVGALRPGQRLAAGEAFAALGATQVNGGWPPHLHLQVLAADPADLAAVPPGVADPDDVPGHAALYPDPSPLLGLAGDRAVCRDTADESLRARRAAHFAANLRTSYEVPLALVRGQRHVLFDRQGRRHLDAYNNVPHVGHCHARVVRAIAEQTALLATNTRYLHDGMVRYAERLQAMLPPPLSVFFFTASGSEANELALRLVRAHTGRVDLCVMDHGYHGHTTGAMAVSPYKFVQPGAPPRPDWVHVTVQPDVYRGAFAGPDAGARYAAEVAAVIAGLEARGRSPAGYLCECLPSVGGQLILPDGFLAVVYARVRAAGGLCIADDVQTALWRTGTHAFGFQRYGVVPDVLVLGKPLGNGFPLGAVVTTAAVAASFARGPEFFSTFGGSTVAMAAGLAVLDVLDDEGLAGNALRTGEHLRRGLRALQQRHECIGDVRGAGLFLGVELVADRDRKTPASEAANRMKNRLRQRRILIGTEGPFDNVLKIRPPMTFDTEAADVLLAELDRALAQDQGSRGA